MKINFKTLINQTFVLLMVLWCSSCNQNVKKVKVDTQLAVALFSDTVSLQEIINDMDSTSNAWLRVRNDSIFVYYVDTINDVLKASDLLNNIEDVDFSTTTGFNMPMPYSDLNGKQDIELTIDRFLTIPFSYDGFVIDTVLLRSGELRFEFNVSPQLSFQKSLEIYSPQIISPAGEMLNIIIDYENMTPLSVNLADYRVLPSNDTVTFGARITVDLENGIYNGGDYTCELSGSIKNVMFKTLYGTLEMPLDSLFQDRTEIDFGINGLTGNASLPIPNINIAFNNTFGLGVQCNITQLEFINQSISLVTDLLDSDVVEVLANPTDGVWRRTKIQGLAEEINALAGYTRLDFAGELALLLNDDHFSISDTSTFSVATDIEIPFSFKLNDLCYNDTIAINISGMDGESDNKLIDEIDFYIDYNSKIKIDVNMQALFMEDNVVIDSLFLEGNSLNYSATDEISTISVIVTDQKLANVLRADKMVLRLCASTEAISPDPVQMMNSDAIFMRFRVLTKSSEIGL